MGLVALLRSLREKLLDNETEDKKSKQSNKQLRDNLKELDSSDEYIYKRVSNTPGPDTDLTL